MEHPSATYEEDAADDRSEEPQLRAKGEGAAPAQFLLKTYDLVDDPACDDAIAWSAAGNSFVVHNQVALSPRLATVFKHNNFSSFLRQLNQYGFRKVSSSRLEFANGCFVRGQRELLGAISRRKKSAPAAAAARRPDRDAADGRDTSPAAATPRGCASAGAGGFGGAAAAALAAARHWPGSGAVLAGEGGGPHALGATYAPHLGAGVAEDVARLALAANEALRQENATLHAELERMRGLYEATIVALHKHSRMLHAAQAPAPAPPIAPAPASAAPAAPAAAGFRAFSAERQPGSPPRLETPTAAAGALDAWAAATKRPAAASDGDDGAAARPAKAPRSASAGVSDASAGTVLGSALPTASPSCGASPTVVASLLAAAIASSESRGGSQPEAAGAPPPLRAAAAPESQQQPWGPYAQLAAASGLAALPPQWTGPLGDALRNAIAMAAFTKQHQAQGKA